MLSYEFVILEVNGAGCEFALDDIFWDGGLCTDVVLGDINNDTLVDVLDIVQLVGIILGTVDPNDFQIEASDINDDSTIDVLDVVILVDIILG